MSEIWQRFVSTFGDAEAAAVALLVAIGGVVASVVIFVHWLVVGRYTAAVGLIVALGAAVGVCIRDYRRGRWSILSGALLTIWLLATAVALAFDIWVTYGRV